MQKDRVVTRESIVLIVVGFIQALAHTLISVYNWLAPSSALCDFADWDDDDEGH